MLLIKRIIRKFRKKKAKVKISPNYKSETLIATDGEDTAVPLTEIGNRLPAVHSIQGKGVWKPQDFLFFREKLKTGINSLAANIHLMEVDLGEVSLPQQSETIDMQYLFHFCVNLTRVVLPDATHFPGEVNMNTTFCGCSKLKEVKNLGTYLNIKELHSTFRYCSLLSSLDFGAISLPKGNTKTFQHINRQIIVRVPKGAKIPSNWSQIKPENVERI